MRPLNLFLALSSHGLHFDSLFFDLGRIVFPAPHLFFLLRQEVEGGSEDPSSLEPFICKGDL